MNIYGDLRKDISRILRQLCEWAIEQHAMLNHVHILIKKVTQDECFEDHGLFKRTKCEMPSLFTRNISYLKYSYCNRTFGRADIMLELLVQIRRPLKSKYRARIWGSIDNVLLAPFRGAFCVGLSSFKAKKPLAMLVAFY